MIGANVKNAMLQVGGSVLYKSTTLNTWMETQVAAVDPQSGSIQVNLKPGVWISADEQATRIRPTGTEVAKSGANALDYAMRKVGFQFGDSVLYYSTTRN